MTKPHLIILDDIIDPAESFVDVSSRADELSKFRVVCYPSLEELAKKFELPVKSISLSSTLQDCLIADYKETLNKADQWFDMYRTFSGPKLYIPQKAYQPVYKHLIADSTSKVRQQKRRRFIQKLRSQYGIRNHN